VAALGHRNARVQAAVVAQPVVHALGDLAEAEVTAELRARLPWPAKLGVTGEDAGAGVDGTIQATPPLTITDAELDEALDRLA
jgi:4-aminobutyrate aminotransferase-like enzyme